MRPNFQLIHDDRAAGIYGDCMRTCIASLLDLYPDEVPHFLHDDSDEWLVRLNNWLGYRQLAYLLLPVPDVSNVPLIFSMQGHDMYHLMTVRTANGGCHQIIGRNGKPVWCPTRGDVTGREYEVIEVGFLVCTSL